MEAAEILRAVAALLKAKAAAMLQEPLEDLPLLALRQGEAVSLGLIAAQLLEEAADLERQVPLVPLVPPVRPALPVRPACRGDPPDPLVMTTTGMAMIQAMTTPRTQARAAATTALATRATAEGDER